MIYEYKRTAKYYETDTMGVVHHSNYIRWFEEGRIEFMRNSDLSYKVMEDEGIQIPVVSVSCKYRVPTKFDDAVTIRIKIQKYNGIVLELSYEVIKDEDGTLLATGESSHCFVNDKTFKPVLLKRERPDMHNKFLKVMED